MRHYFCRRVYLHNLAELQEQDRCLALTSDDFRRVNPNTGTAPIFRSRRNQEITTGIYRRLPVLVDRSTGENVQAWPIKYVRMFDMSNDSDQFRTRSELEDNEGAWHVGGNTYDSPSGRFFPLYEGKMVQAFDHRAASVVVNPANRHRPGVPKPATRDEHRNPAWCPDPQYWVPDPADADPVSAILGFKNVTAATNGRAMIAALIPTSAAGNSLPLLMWRGNPHADVMASGLCLLLANLNACILDFVVRQKVQGQNLNLFLVEQLPVVPPMRYSSVFFGPKSAAQIIREAVLELTYTSFDMARFAEDLGYTDEKGTVHSPFIWDEDRRLRLMAKIDAVFFQLYGVTDRDDIRYIYSTFPIVERHEQKTFGTYRSRDLCLAYLNALRAGQPDAEPE